MRQDIKDIKLSIRKISEKAEQQQDIVRFDIGQPSFDTPQHVKEAAKNKMKEKQGYAPTMGLKKLRQLIAEEESSKKRVNFSHENILVTAGGMEALYSIFASYLEAEDKAVLNDPCWGPYKLISSVNGNKFSQVEYFDEDGFRDQARIEFEKADIAVVNTPSNPTGKVLDDKEAREVARAANETDTVLLCDEVYHRLVYDSKHVSPAPFADEPIVIGSCSKNHAMTGWRVGWAAADNDTVENLAKASRGMTASTPKISQLAAIEALENDSHVEKMRKEYKERRNLVEKRVSNLAWNFENPEGAIYAFPNVGSDSWNFCLEMIDKGVAMVPGKPFGPESNENIRICFGSTEKEEIRKAFDILEESGIT